eukprot:scaffold20011_cov33-Tisochrysis_lutea.AAC.5
MEPPPSSTTRINMPRGNPSSSTKISESGSSGVKLIRLTPFGSPDGPRSMSRLMVVRRSPLSEARGGDRRHGDWMARLPTPSSDAPALTSSASSRSQGGGAQPRILRARRRLPDYSSLSDLGRTL